MADPMRHLKAKSMCDRLTPLSVKLPGRMPLLLASFLLTSLLPLVSAAADGAPASGTDASVALLEPSNKDLLLFWEEKELYVETATRIEKPLAQVAENMTVVTAKEIEDMNAHSVAEVLNRVPGLFVDFAGQDFNGFSLLKSQGSSPRQVTVLLDGVVWNNLSGGVAETSTIPVRIIDRIEIIKGPASSAWGSALGGVVNIITKGTGETAVPKGVLSASYGEASSQDYNAELLGKNGPVGYYLYGGRQQTDGLRNNRNMDQDRVYAKVNVAPSRDLDLLFTTGYSNPLVNSGDVTGNGITLNSKQKLTTFFVTGAFDYRISPELSLKGAAHLFQQKFEQPTTFVSSFLIAKPGDLFKGFVWDEETVGGSLKLHYTGDMHAAVLGMEVSHGSMDQTSNAGPLYQLFGFPATSITSPSVDKWALFANDTIDLGKLAVTPGIRLDRDTITGYFASPSIGATYELAEHAVVRASIARGFTSPPLSYTSGGGPFRAANPALKREEGWSYQVGLESGVTDYLHVKGTLFRHDTTKAISDTTITNVGDVVRQGYELEAETVPLWNVSLRAAHAYAHIHADSPPAGLNKGSDNYSYLIGLKYDDRHSLMAQLTGSYVWMDQPLDQHGQYHTFIWDFNLNKRIFTTDKTSTEIFTTVHNLFSGPHYFNSTYQNALRWVEGGVRFRF